MILERFKVPHGEEVHVPEQSLRRTVTAIFEKMGLSPEDAAEGADVLVSTDLRAVESHGVSNMLRAYVQGYQAGSLNPKPNWRIVREFPATATIDADRGLGIIMGPKAMRIAIDKARKVGMGVVTMYNSGHLGAVGHHAMLAAKEDMVGVCMTAGSLLVVPTFGAEPRFGTNPISIAAPTRHEAPFLYDAATSAIAGNKIRLAARVGASLLPGWITDKEGTPIMEETPVMDRGQYFQLPLGGTREQGSHKGYGLALMAEVLGTVLSGAVPNMVQNTNTFRNYFAAYNIAAFTDVDHFKDTMDRMLETLRTTRPAPGHDRVLYPGLSEYEEEQERRAKGIPLHKEVIQWFEGITRELSLPGLDV
jgi:LDH2 family malate/lactate/ureidoglycolate dehydrogenase